MKLFKLAAIVFAPITIFTACTKDNSEYITETVSKKAQLITCQKNAVSKREWILKEYRYKDASASTWTDGFNDIPLCLRDDGFSFDLTGYVKGDNNNYVCTPGEERYKYSGVWKFANGENSLQVDMTPSGSFIRTIVSVDSAKMVLAENVGTTTHEYTYSVE